MVMELFQVKMADDAERRLTSFFQDRPFLGYLASMSAEKRQQLIKSPICALFTLKMLPGSGQALFMKLLVSGLNRWQDFTPVEKANEVYDVINLMLKVGIVHGNPNERVYIDPEFRINYMVSLQTGIEDIIGMRRVPLNDEKSSKRVTVGELAKKAAERWESILRYLALPSEQVNSQQMVGSITKTLFQQCGFTREAGNEVEITSEGFQFLLLNRVEQMWMYIINYLRYIDNSLPVLEFLLRLTQCVDSAAVGATLRMQKQSNSKSSSDEKDGYGAYGSTVGRAYYCEEHWSEEVMKFLSHLRELGFVFMRKRKDGYFYITPMLFYLSMSNSAIESQGDLAKSRGFIIVETNFRVYAYTDSTLQLAILSTFTDMTYRFNDMSVGVLTRESVRKALQTGVTAKQIVSYLRANAHKNAIESNGPLLCVPITVADQIMLWEEERKRLSFFPSMMYNAFDSEREYQEVKAFATRSGVVLWHDDTSLTLIVTETGHSTIKEWWKSKPR
ncbi:hypothetical protein QR680_009585 [Steinernema hermaphroditum]|uniref:General transcription factor IIH subunit 4 n=1 Tax=Steinernema hermaphroditum TaxID=289476 RepID=A0AA39IMX2_9BILA|nr:hypothetical protein QR680_009585 [Steinernema hermaphroditum]